MSMALCHILPEADAMYGKFLAEKEAAEKAALPKLEHDHDGDGHDDHDEEEHEEEEGEHHDEDEEEEGEHHDEEEEAKEMKEEDHDDHAGHSEEAEHGFPFAYTLFLVGFLIMLFMDKVLFAKAEINVGKDQIISKSKIEEMVIKNASSESNKEDIEITEKDN